MKLNIFDLKSADEETLFELVWQTIKTFPILKEIYDEAFIQSLIKNRFYFNNYLLWLLSSKEPYTVSSWTEITRCLWILHECDVVTHFKDKLRSTDEHIFKSYQTELDYASYYKERGFNVELEPSLPNSGKNPEFVIASDELKVYFEAKNIFWEEMMKERALTTQIQGTLGKIDELYVFSIFFSPELSIGDIGSLRKLFFDSLKQLGANQPFPVKIHYRPAGKVLAEIVVHGRPNKLSYGYLGGIQRSEAFALPNSEWIRRKISKKVPQLPETEADVIVIEPGDFGISKDSMVDALYGDEEVVFTKNSSTNDFSAKAHRKRNGFYQPNKNTRISAIIFSDKKFRENAAVIRWKSVFHNPFAKKPLDRSLFDDKNVEQFMPIENGDSVKMTWC